MLLALEKRKFFLDFREKLIVMNGHVKYMQQKFINRKLYRETKVEMLKLYWTQVLAWFVRRGCEMMDK